MGATTRTPSPTVMTLNFVTLVAHGLCSAQSEHLPLLLLTVPRSLPTALWGRHHFLHVLGEARKSQRDPSVLRSEGSLTISTVPIISFHWVPMSPHGGACWLSGVHRSRAQPLPEGRSQWRSLGPVPSYSSTPTFFFLPPLPFTLLSQMQSGEAQRGLWEGHPVPPRSLAAFIHLHVKMGSPEVGDTRRSGTRASPPLVMMVGLETHDIMSYCFHP